MAFGGGQLFAETREARSDMRRSETVAAQISFLRPAGQRTRTGVRAEYGRPFSAGVELIPAAILVPRHGDHARQAGGKE